MRTVGQPLGTRILAFCTGNRRRRFDGDISDDYCRSVSTPKSRYGHGYFRGEYCLRTGFGSMHTQKPQDTFSPEGDILRPDLRLFSSQVALLNTQKNALDARNMPRLNLFVQGGYGFALLIVSVLLWETV